MTNAMKIKRLTRFLCIFLSCLLMLTGCSSGESSQGSPMGSQAQTAQETEALTPETEVPETEAESASTLPVLDVPDEIVPEHSDMNFEDMVYERPDLDAVDADFDTALQLIEEQAGEEEIFAAYDTLMDDISHISTMSTLASIHSDLDLNDSYYEEESTLLDNALTRLDNRMNEVTEAILNSSHASAFTQRMGSDFVERYEFYSQLNSPEIEELSAKENDLISEYKQLLAKEYTTQLNGEEVTINDLDLSATEAIEAYYDIYMQKNAECAEVYLELVRVRTEIARTLGYDSYADYAYDSLGRDFSKEDAAQFSEMVKEYIVPLYTELESRYYMQLMLAQYDSSLTVEDGVDYLREALEAEFPPAMTEALDYMLEHNLYVFDDGAEVMPAAYSTIIGEYGAPFLLINTATYTDPSTLFHEFGHYYNFYLMGDIQWNDNNNLDLAEVHSQGLELLMFQYYPEVYGSNSDIMQISVIYNLLYSILSGCCEDEFQQRVFENPDMTVDEMNLLHGELYQEYFGYPLYYEWVDIHHHFETPFYYISYATSAASAFEIWELSETSRPAALAAYRSITQNTLNCGYLEPLANAGLSNPFTSDMIEQVAEAISSRYLTSAQDSAA